MLGEFLLFNLNCGEIVAISKLCSYSIVDKECREENGGSERSNKRCK